MAEKVENRWAVWNYRDKFFCGKFCWRVTDNNANKIPTFRTRDLARRAILQMWSYADESRPVKVTVTITTVGQGTNEK